MSITVIGGGDLVEAASLSERSERVWSAQTPFSRGVLVVRQRDGRTAFMSYEGHRVALSALPEEHSVRWEVAGGTSAAPASIRVEIERIGEFLVSGSTMGEVLADTGALAVLHRRLVFLGRGRLSLVVRGYTSMGALGWESKSHLVDFSAANSVVELLPVVER